MRGCLLGLAFFFLAFTAPAMAQERVVYRVSNGTGFVINPAGHIITNEHVVRGCQSISILTPSGEQSASLVATSPEQDLAALRMASPSDSIAPLRWNIGDMKVGEPLSVIGYPGEQGARGIRQTRQTRLKSLRGPSGEERWIQMESVAAKGNSGGPVLDQSGNVIGVVTAIATIYRADQNHQPIGQPTGQVDVAITLPALRAFLTANRIGFVESVSGAIGYTRRGVDGQQRFIVPVRCIQGRA